MKFILSFYRYWKSKGKKDEDMMYATKREELDNIVKELNKNLKSPGFFRVRKEGEE